MEKFERFSEERLTSLRARYRGDDLFRTWTWILCLLEQQLNGLNAVEVWSENGNDSPETVCNQGTS